MKKIELLLLLILLLIIFSCQRYSISEKYECEVVRLKRKLKSDFELTNRLADIPKKTIKNLRRKTSHSIHITDDINHKQYLRGYDGLIFYGESDVLNIFCLKREGGGIVKNIWYFIDKNNGEIMKISTFITINNIEKIRAYINSIDTPYYTDCYR